MKHSIRTALVNRQNKEDPAAQRAAAAAGTQGFTTTHAVTLLVAAIALGGTMYNTDVVDETSRHISDRPQHQECVSHRTANVLVIGSQGFTVRVP